MISKIKEMDAVQSVESLIKIMLKDSSLRLVKAHGAEYSKPDTEMYVDVASNINNRVYRSLVSVRENRGFDKQKDDSCLRLVNYNHGNKYHVLNPMDRYWEEFSRSNNGAFWKNLFSWELP